jgi:hypothetical protein
MSLPPSANETSYDESNCILQISLSFIGNKSIAKQYAKKLRQLKKIKKPFSTVNFKVHAQQEAEEH